MISELQTSNYDFNSFKQNQSPTGETMLSPTRPSEHTDLPNDFINNQHFHILSHKAYVLNKRMPKKMSETPRLFDRNKNMFTKDGSVLQNDMIKSKIVATPFFKREDTSGKSSEFVLRSRISSNDRRKPEFNLMINEAPITHYNHIMMPVVTMRDGFSDEGYNEHQSD